MTELNDLGFEVVKSYTHDEYMTQRRKKGIIILETTWEMPSGNFEKQDLMIDEEWIEGFTRNDLINLDKIMNSNDKYAELSEMPHVEEKNKYKVTIKGVSFDVYDVLKAFDVTCPARQHAIKKLLKTGQRGFKDERKDLNEAIDSINRSIELL